MKPLNELTKDFKKLSSTEIKLELASMKKGMLSVLITRNEIKIQAITKRKFTDDPYALSPNEKVALFPMLYNLDEIRPRDGSISMLVWVNGFDNKAILFDAMINKKTASDEMKKMLADKCEMATNIVSDSMRVRDLFTSYLGHESYVATVKDTGERYFVDAHVLGKILAMNKEESSDNKAIDLLEEILDIISGGSIYRVRF